MGHKIFVSYKYGDHSVYNLLGTFKNCSVRDYVDRFQSKIDISDHIFKGEDGDEDLSHLSDSSIWESLKRRIRDSTLTIVFISKGMRIPGIPERDQWIPWEISYSLKEYSRKDSQGNPVASRTNAMLGIVLPDSYNSYSYIFDKKLCCESECITQDFSKTFSIIQNNTFNLISGGVICSSGLTIWHGEPSYIKIVKWDNFISNINKYINIAYDIQSNIDDYNICYNIS